MTTPDTGAGVETDDETGTVEEIDLANDPLAKFLNSQRYQWKAYSSVQAKQKVKGLLAGLDFDADTAAQIEDEILADVDRQMDSVINMMIGTEDLDPDAFTVFTGTAAGPQFRRSKRSSARFSPTTRSTPFANA